VLTRTRDHTVLPATYTFIHKWNEPYLCLHQCWLTLMHLGAMSLLCVCRYEVTSTSPVTFVWAFQKKQSEQVDDGQSTTSLHDDVAKIYSVEVTNPRRGGAEMCKLCPQGASLDGYDSSSHCIPLCSGVQSRWV